MHKSFLLLAHGMLAFKVNDVAQNTTAGYEEISVRQRLDLRPSLSDLAFHGAASDRLIKPFVPKDSTLNGLVESVHLACVNHHALKLTPDTVFFAILQGIATKFRFNRTLREKYFGYSSRRHYVRYWFSGFKDGDEWEEIVSNLKDYLQARTHAELYADVATPFSTSSKVTAGLFPLAMKSDMPNCYTHEMRSFFVQSIPITCEIPEVKLAGRPEDWKQLKIRAEVLLRRFEFNNWQRTLNPVLGEFVAFAEGNVNSTFWKQIYHREGAADKALVSGWINAFFPIYYRWYSGNLNSCVEGDLNACEGLPVGAYPVVALRYTFKIRQWFSDYFADAVMDIFGAQKSSEPNTIQPALGWAVFLDGKRKALDSTLPEKDYTTAN